MVTWTKYKDLEPIRRLRNNGRELLGNDVLLTEKRDGENVSLFINDEGTVQIASHNLATADQDIQNRMKKVPEYSKCVDLLQTELADYGSEIIIYGELLKAGHSPTRVERQKKHPHWILFDIWDSNAQRYIPYTRLYQYAKKYRLPIVTCIRIIQPMSMEELQAEIDDVKSWCNRHRREGVVGKDYHNQTFFKEKIDLPKRPKLKTTRKHPMYPPLPLERIMRALEHAFDEVGEENWMDKSKAMPTFARHVSAECREHNFSMPSNIYQYYINTSIEELRPNEAEAETDST